MMAEMRKPKVVTIDITQKCNLRCLHCFNHSGEKITSAKELTDNQLMDLCNQIIALECQVVCLCGGEPLLRENIINKMTETLTRGGINVN